MPVHRLFAAALLGRQVHGHHRRDGCIRIELGEGGFESVHGERLAGFGNLLSSYPKTDTRKMPTVHGYPFRLLHP